MPDSGATTGNAGPAAPSSLGPGASTRPTKEGSPTEPVAGAPGGVLRRGPPPAGPWPSGNGGASGTRTPGGIGGSRSFLRRPRPRRRRQRRANRTATTASPTSTATERAASSAGRRASSHSNRRATPGGVRPTVFGTTTCTVPNTVGRPPVRTRWTHNRSAASDGILTVPTAENRRPRARASPGRAPEMRPHPTRIAPSGTARTPVPPTRGVRHGDDVLVCPSTRITTGDEPVPTLGLPAICSLARSPARSVTARRAMVPGGTAETGSPSVRNVPTDDRRKSPMTIRAARLPPRPAERARRGRRCTRRAMPIRRPGAGSPGARPT